MTPPTTMIMMMMMMMSTKIDEVIEIGGCYGMEMNVEKTKVMRISRQPFLLEITIGQKKLENVEYV